MKIFRSRPSGSTVLFFCLLVCAVSLLLYPVPAMEAVSEGLYLCFETVIPSLFPFLVISSLLTALFPRALLQRRCSPITRRLFRLDGEAAAVLALGFCGGYPVGVRTTVTLYRSGVLSRSDAEHLLAFSNNSGPGFILGVVGVGLFSSVSVGLTLYVIHICSALLVGVLFRYFKSEHIPPQGRSCAASAPHFPKLLTEAITGSFGVLLNICSFVLFFMVVCRMLSFFGILHALAAVLTALLAPLGMTEPLATAALAGFLELSTGCACLEGVALTPLSAALLSFLLGWGGLSVHFQSLCFLLDSDLSAAPYWRGKLLQALFAFLITFLTVPAAL